MCVGSAQDKPVNRERPIRIQGVALGTKNSPIAELCVLDGELMFIVTFENYRIPGTPGDPPLPDFSLQFIKDGQLLRTKVVPINTVIDRQGKFSKQLLAKDGAYVTADFSTDPPKVILTEKPTEHSRWTFVNRDGQGLGYDGISDVTVRLKNEGAPGKAIWLSMEKKGTTYRGGIARTPILSAEKEEYFFIEDANSGK